MAEQDQLVAGRYRLGSQVGSGAMGVVWQAHDERLARSVAVKQVLINPGADEASRELASARVMREGRITARLHHPRAITVYDVVEHEGRPCLIMEYLASRSLAAVLADRGVLPADEVARIGRQIAEALTAAHAAGIVHRDVKPANVLIDDEGSAKITDFGISRAVDDVTLTATGMMAGTPAYLAPEIARGGAAGFSSDVYSLGSTLYAALEGTPPFGNTDNALALLHRVASGEIEAPRRPGPLTPLVLGLLEREPAQRPAMEQVRDLLGLMISAGTETQPGTPTPFLPRPDPAQITVPQAHPAHPAAPVAPAAVPERAGPPPSQQRTRPVPPPTGTAAGPPEEQSGKKPRRRRGAIAAAVAVTVVVAAGILVALATGVGHNSAATTAGTSGSASSTADPTPDGPTAATPANPSSTAATAPGATAAAPVQGTPTQRQQQDAVIGYYALVPRQLPQGWAQLTSSYQQSTAGGFSGYTGFWSNITQVSVTDVSPQPGDSVQATITYTYRDGRTTQEQTLFRMVQQDRTWKIDNSTVRSSR